LTVEGRGRPKFGFSAETDSFCGFGRVSFLAEVLIHLLVNFRFRPKVTVNFGCKPNVNNFRLSLPVKKTSQSCIRPEPPPSVCLQRYYELLIRRGLSWQVVVPVWSSMSECGRLQESPDYTAAI